MTEPADFLTACELHPDPPACAEYLVQGVLGRWSCDNATCVVITFDDSSGGISDRRNRLPS